jgi:NAD(P)-dependent dehydrogenase (short-subunit alcohol dehydrogenase family)
MPSALITGASQGLGRALARALAERGWSLVVDARSAADLAAAMADLPPAAAVTVIPGDVTDPRHRAELAAAAGRGGRLDALINNASRLGPSPQPPLRDYPLGELETVYQTNVVAPLALFQLLAGPLEAAGGAVVNLSSDAAAEAYPGWGGYGSAKAALDHLTAILAVEHPGLRCYAVDPGDMRTVMHQQAFPGEDISDRPEPEAVVPALLALLAGGLPSGRYRAADVPDLIGLASAAGLDGRGGGDSPAGRDAAVAS